MDPLENAKTPEGLHAKKEEKNTVDVAAASPEAGKKTVEGYVQAVKDHNKVEQEIVIIQRAIFLQKLPKDRADVPPQDTDDLLDPRITALSKMKPEELQRMMEENQKKYEKMRLRREASMRDVIAAGRPAVLPMLQELHTQLVGGSDDLRVYTEPCSMVRTICDKDEDAEEQVVQTVLKWDAQVLRILLVIPTADTLLSKKNLHVLTAALDGKRWVQEARRISPATQIEVQKLGDTLSLETRGTVQPVIEDHVMELDYLLPTLSQEDARELFHACVAEARLKRQLQKKMGDLAKKAKTPEEKDYVAELQAMNADQQAEELDLRRKGIAADLQLPEGPLTSDRLLKYLNTHPFGKDDPAFATLALDIFHRSVTRKPKRAERERAETLTKLMGTQASEGLLDRANDSLASPAGRQTAAVLAAESFTFRPASSEDTRAFCLRVQSMLDTPNATEQTLGLRCWKQVCSTVDRRFSSELFKPAAIEDFQRMYQKLGSMLASEKDPAMQELILETIERHRELARAENRELANTSKENLDAFGISRLAQSTDSAPVRLIALRTLRTIPSPGSVAVLQETLKKEGATDVERRVAMNALAAMPSNILLASDPRTSAKVCADILMNRLRSKATSSQRQAATVLGNLLRSALGGETTKNRAGKALSTLMVKKTTPAIAPVDLALARELLPLYIASYNEQYINSLGSLPKAAAPLLQELLQKTPDDQLLRELLKRAEEASAWELPPKLPVDNGE